MELESERRKHQVLPETPPQTEEPKPESPKYRVWSATKGITPIIIRAEDEHHALSICLDQGYTLGKEIHDWDFRNRIV